MATAFAPGLLPNGGGGGSGHAGGGAPGTIGGIPVAATQQFCLKWNNHTTNLIKTFGDMVSNETFADVTLACDGHLLKAHKIVLSACSNYFKEVFLATPCKHPVVILKDIKVEDLKAIIDFMYRGEVNVSQNQLGNLLRTAEVLRVKGLTEVNDEGFKAAENDLTGQMNNDLGVAQHQVIDPKCAVAAHEGLLGQVAAAAAAIGGQPYLVTQEAPMETAVTTPGTVSPSSRRKKRKPNPPSTKQPRSRTSTSQQPGKSPIPISVPSTPISVAQTIQANISTTPSKTTVSADLEDEIAQQLILQQQQHPQIQLHEQQAGVDGDTVPSSDDEGGEGGVKSLMKAAAAAEARDSIIANSFAGTSTGDVSAYVEQHSSPTRRRIAASAAAGRDSAEGSNPDGVSNDGSESWSQGNHGVSIGIRSADGGDDSTAEDGEIKPSFMFVEGEGTINLPGGIGSQEALQGAGTPNQDGSGGNKVCVCHLCHLTFTAYSSLRRHMARHFQDRERYECDVCFKSYSRKDYLKEHKKLKHQQQSQGSS